MQWFKYNWLQTEWVHWVLFLFVKNNVQYHETVLLTKASLVYLMCKQDMMSSRWKWCCVQIHGGWSYSSINTWRSRSSSSTQSMNQLCASLPPEHRHMCTQHLEMIRHPENREALLIEPGLITQEEAAQRRRRRSGGADERKQSEREPEKAFRRASPDNQRFIVFCLYTR